MLFQTLFLWIIFFFFLIPILLSGILILKRFSTVDRFELLLPAGSILGLAFFVFSVNFSAFFVKGMSGVIFAYFLLIVLTLFIYFKGSSTKVSYPRGKALFFYIISVVAWSAFLIWKGSFALVGSDTNLYFAVAHSFIKGNFPPVTPWQPDLPLAYHIGASQLLGAFYGLSNLSFNFLHIFFSVFFIFCSSQIILWIWRRHSTLISFILGNVAVAVTLISFGFFKIVIPLFPLDLQNITSLRGLFFWIRDLPTVNQSIEVYGAPVNLDGLIYFIFHAFGLALLLSLVVILINSPKQKKVAVWIMLLVGLSSLALINESIFAFGAPVIVLVGLLKKTNKLILLLLLIATAVITFQGGIITNTLLSKTEEKSVLIAPDRRDVKEDFVNYHYYQVVSKVLPQKNEWRPFLWIHPGLDLTLIISIIILIFIKVFKEQRFLIFTLFLLGLLSLLAYHLIVPKFLIANGNRFLAFSFLFFSLSIVLPLQDLILLFKKRVWFASLIFALITFFIVLPTILPPLFLLSKNRFGENQLIPRTLQSSEGILWLKKNIGLQDRVMVLDKNAPHPSGQARALVEAGTFAPIFFGNFRFFTIEASPEYFDVAFTLSPQALKSFKISTLFLDSFFYETLPISRKEQLQSDKYFTKVFESSKEANWEKIFKVKDEYLNEGGEIEGTLAQMTTKLPTKGAIFIDNEENFNPSYLRRAIIFGLRERDLYFLPQSGVYLNVEASINGYPPKDDGSYDYLVLGKKSKPEDICKCRTKLLWTGVKDEVFIWQRI